MQDAPSDEHAASVHATSVRVGVVGSVALHAALVLLLSWAPALPDVDFDLVLPSEVEFGVPEPEPAAVEQPAVAPAPPEPQAPDEPPAPDEPKPKPKPKPKPAAPDAGTADAATPDAATEERQPEPEKPSDKPALLSAFAPKGSQISVRMDVALVRASPLSEDVRLLLGDAPDFRAVVEGSGIDAIRDLERLYLASPDLRRENVVIAGQYSNQPELPKRAVASLASSASKPARWKLRDGVSIAPWLNRDTTERVVALLPSSQFVITAKKDLARVLAVARAFDPRQAELRDPSSDPGTALLALEPGVAGVLTVYDARRFARGNLRGIPTFLEAKARILEDGGVAVSIRGELEDADRAQDAVAYWSRMRDRFAANALVAIIGMRSPIVSAAIRAEDRFIVIDGTLSQQQARTLLGFARSTVMPPPPPRVPVKPEKIAPPAP